MSDLTFMQYNQVSSRRALRLSYQDRERDFKSERKRDSHVHFEI